MIQIPNKKGNKIVMNFILFAYNNLYHKSEGEIIKMTYVIKKKSILSRFFNIQKQQILSLEVLSRGISSFLLKYVTRFDYYRIRSK